MNRCISKKEYLQKDNSNVGYALYVQNNIKKDDYARLNTGQIVRIIGIRENELNKKAIYFNIYNEDWCDSAAVENFSDNIIDLIEVGDIVNESLIVYRGKVASGKEKLVVGNYIINGMFLEVVNIKTILTHEQYERNCYKIN